MNIELILKTERLRIRPVSTTDVPELFTYRSDRETNKYQGWIPVSIDEMQTFVEKAAKRINEPGTWFQWVVIEQKSHQIIGDLGMHFLDKESRQVEIGCTLNKDFQNKGYATEMVKGAIAYLFDDLNKHRVITSIDPANTSAIRLVERIGFRKEAHFVESLWLNGEWVDDLVFALLKKEWNSVHHVEA